MALVSSISSVLGTREDRRTATMSLLELDKDGSPTTNKKFQRSFQYYPETINDSRSVNWNSKNTVGSSHPIYQWTNGSERTISFEAVFTRDIQPPSTQKTSLASTVANIGATISSFSKNPVGSAIGALKSAAADPYNVNISAAVAWLRAKTYPSYNSDGLASAPPKLLLIMPNSGVVSQVGDFAVDSIPVIMTSCNVTYEAFFRNGAIRVATVSLEFAEIVQIGTTGWGFVDRSDVDLLWNSKDGYTPNADPYPASQFKSALPLVGGFPTLNTGGLA